MSTIPEQDSPAQIYDRLQTPSTANDSDAPPYRRWGEVNKDERPVSTQPDSPPWHNDTPSDGRTDHEPQLWSSQERQRLCETDFDHHTGRSSAATIIRAEDADHGDYLKFDRLAKWNDGTRDSDRQSWEGHKDKLAWTDSYGARLELSRHVVQQAKLLLHDLGDIRRLGHYNSLHTAVLAALVESYKKWYLLTCGHSDTRQSWRQRDDFTQLRENIGLTESKLNDAAKLLCEKTDINWDNSV